MPFLACLLRGEKEKLFSNAGYAEKLKKNALKILLSSTFASDERKEERKKIFFLGFLEQLFKKLRASFREILSNLWKALVTLCKTRICIKDHRRDIMDVITSVVSFSSVSGATVRSVGYSDLLNQIPDFCA